MVDDALGGDRGAYPVGDDAGNFEHPVTAVEANGHDIADSYLRGWLGDGPVHRHVARAARLGGHAAGFEHAHGPDPPVHPSALHATDCFRAPTLMVVTSLAGVDRGLLAHSEHQGA